MEQSPGPESQLGSVVCLRIGAEWIRWCLLETGVGAGSGGAGGRTW